MPAKSEKQRKFMALVRAYKRGETTDVSDAVKEAAKSMTDEEITDFMKKEAAAREQCESFIDDMLEKRASSCGKKGHRAQNRAKHAAKIKEAGMKKAAAESPQPVENVFQRIDREVGLMAKEAGYIPKEANKVKSGMELGKQLWGGTKKIVDVLTNVKKPVGATAGIIAPGAFGAYKGKEYWDEQKELKKDPSLKLALAKALGWGTTVSPAYWRFMATSPAAKTLDPTVSAVVGGTTSAALINAPEISQTYDRLVNLSEMAEKHGRKAEKEFTTAAEQFQTAMDKLSPSAAYESKKIQEEVYRQLRAKYPKQNAERHQQMAEAIAMKAKDAFQSTGGSGGGGGGKPGGKPTPGPYQETISKMLDKDYAKMEEAWDKASTLEEARQAVAGEALADTMQKQMKGKGVAATTREAVEGAVEPIQEFYKKHKGKLPYIAGGTAVAGVGAYLLWRRLQKKREEEEKARERQALAAAIAKAQQQARA